MHTLFFFFFQATKSGFQGNPFTQNKMFSHNNSATDLQLHNSGRPPLPSNSRPPSGQQAYRQTVGILADSRHTDKQQAYKQTSGILSARHVAQNTQEVTECRVTLAFFYVIDIL